MSSATTEELVERLRAGVRQRQAERSTAGDSGSAARLAELFRHQTLSERSPRSHRKVLGPLVVAARTVVRKLFLGWYVGPVIQQQSLYNHAASRAIQDLTEEMEALRAENAALQVELERLRAERTGV